MPAMPITLLDIILLLVMLISGLLAMIRGFMREILSIGAWGVAALVTLYSYPRVLPLAKQYFTSDTVAAAVSAGGWAFASASASLEVCCACARIDRARLFSHPG